MKKGVTYAIFVALLLTMAGCSKYKVASFVMPTWNMQLSAPIFDRTYTLLQMISKDTVQVSNGDTTFLLPNSQTQVFTLIRSQNLNGVSVGNNLKIGAVPQTNVAQSPKDFSIANPPSIHYSAVNPSIVTGSVPFVPAIPKQTQTITPADAFTNFKTATLSTGTLTITIHNGYPAPIIFENGLIYLVDAFGGYIHISVPKDSILGNQTVTLPAVSLAGRTLSDQPTVTFTDSSNGSSSAATIQSDTTISFSASMANVHVSSANAIVPPQPDIVIDSSIVIQDGNKVQTASIDTGSVSLTVRNNYNISIPVSLSIPGLTKSGVSLTRNFTLSPKGTSGSVYATPISLNGYTLNMADPSTGAPSDSLKYSVTAQIPGSNGSYVGISTTDSITASFQLTGLQLSSFSGEVHLANAINIVPDTQKVDLGSFASKFNGAILFGPGTTLQMRINSIGFPCEAHISLIPTSSEYLSLPPVDSAVVDTTIYPNRTNVITLGQSFVKALNAFSEAHRTIPDRFIISGYVLVNPGGTAIGSVKSTDMVTGSGTITMPLDLGIINAQYADTTKTAVITDSSTSAKLANVDSGNVVIEVWNGLPLQVTMMGQLIDTTTHAVLMNFPSDSIYIPAAQINPDGSVKDSVFSKNIVSLTATQARNLGNSYMRFFFRVVTPPGATTVPFMKDNDISLRVYGNFALKVDKSLTGK